MAYLPSEERRKQIIDAAVDVIASHGIAGATTRRIAEKAGAPLGSLHYCFRNKEELMLLVLERAGSTMRISFELVDPNLGLEATIRSSVEAYWRWVRDNLGLHLALLETVMWLVRSERHGERLYSMINDPFGGELLKEKLQEAARLEGRVGGSQLADIARFIVHRFDGLVLEFAESEDHKACVRQVKLLADAMVAVLTVKPLRTIT